MSAKKNLIGKQFGYLTVTKETNLRKNAYVVWECKCSCGKKINASSQVLINGNTKSCGHYRDVAIADRSRTHGLTGGGKPDKFYMLLYSMIARCEYPKDKGFHNYGGRGIKVCKEWRENPLAFKEWCLSNGYKKGLQIDRIDNDGNYEPSNCRFVTGTINSRNRRGLVQYRGECAVEASLRLGGGRTLVHSRIKSGWPIEKAFTTKPLSSQS